MIYQQVSETIWRLITASGQASRGGIYEMSRNVRVDRCGFQMDDAFLEQLKF